MSRRKDRERLLRMKERNPGYVGFRGAETAAVLPPPAEPAPALESVTCSVCQRKRNVPANAVPVNRAEYVCLSCAGVGAES